MTLLLLLNASTTPMPQLIDIHLPPDIGYWPPAPGWWLLATLLIAAIGFTVWLLRKRHRENKYRQHAIVELHAIYHQYQHDQHCSQYLQSVNQLLKRVVRVRFPETQAESLFGQDWLEFLDSTISPESTLIQTEGKALISGPYQSNTQIAQAGDKIDIAALQGHFELWLRRHKKSPRQTRATTATSTPKASVNTATSANATRGRPPLDSPDSVNKKDLIKDSGSLP